MTILQIIFIAAVILVGLWFVSARYPRLREVLKWAGGAIAAAAAFVLTEAGEWLQSLGGAP